jgi:hypothetical protein
MNVNAPQSNQFLSYQNYHHDQLMHHQYFDEAPQSYNFIPYSANEAYASAAAPMVDQVHQQDNFPAMQSNELYEFLPEEIFQLDQPIVKSESQFNSHVVSAVTTTMDPLQLSYTNNNSGEIPSASQSFLDLSSGQIQTNVKYPMNNFSSEINNNGNGTYEIADSAHLQPKTVDNSYVYQDPRLNCAVESEKALKRKHVESEQKLHQNFHQPLFPKRESSCLLQQQTANYYHPELYSNFPTKSNDVYRSMEKYNSNFITNN